MPLSDAIKTLGRCNTLPLQSKRALKEALSELAASLPSGDPDTGIPKVVYVESKADFPESVAGVITLEAGTAYILVGDVDLEGARLETGGICFLGGTSSETAFLTSTGLGAGVPLLTSLYTLPMQNLTFKDVDTCFYINGASIALDWDAINFDSIPNIGEIGDCDNWIYTNSAVLGSMNLKFTGTVGTIGVSNSIFVGSGAAGNIVDIQSTANITRRFRIIYSSVVAFGSSVGINVDAGATIPVEGYILDTCNFSGGSTYTQGVTYLDEKARFIECRGVPNTATVGNYYMRENATVTTISAVDTPVKVAGTTTGNAINQKFTHSDNRLTYTGALTRDIQVSAVASFTGGNNKLIGLYIAKNGVAVGDSEMYATTDGSGKAESITVQTVVECEENDYIEIWVENSSDSSNVTVGFLNVIAKAIT